MFWNRLTGVYVTIQVMAELKLKIILPAGEDLIVCVEVENFPESVYEYARDFDVDEHVEMWVGHRGEGGCPSSVREIIDDADAIKEMLEELADRLAEVE